LTVVAVKFETKTKEIKIISQWLCERR